MKQESGNYDSIFPCIVKCPYCSEEGDYWRTNHMNGQYGERSIILCLYCNKHIDVISNGGNLQVVTDGQKP